MKLRWAVFKVGVPHEESCWGVSIPEVQGGYATYPQKEGWSFPVKYDIAYVPSWAWQFWDRVNPRFK